MAKKVASELPYNIDAEKAVIGSALINKEAANYVTTSLVEEDFYSGKNRLIFRAMINILNNKHGVVDSITVTDELINMKELENIGGVPYKN
jgi:replicative DNA helicase